MASYATPEQLLQRHDARLINDLVGDENVRQARGDLGTDVNVLAALADASGAIEASLVVGSRYSTDDLDDLTGNSKSHLQRICSDIAMAYLYDRRPSLNPDEYERYWKLATRHLKTLREGENIFNLQGPKDASVPTLDGPTSIVYTNMNLIPDRVPRYFPARESRLPLDRR